MSEFASATITKRGNQLHVSHGDDSGLFVRFYDESLEMPFLSEQAGHPVYQDVPYIQIMFPGDRTKEVKRPVKMKGDESSPSDAQRFSREWEAYKAQSEAVTVGMPVTEWAPLTKSQAMALKTMNIHTVEQLAEVPDHLLSWMGAREMSQKARAWLKQAGDNATALKLQAENDALRADIETLKQQFAEMSTKRGK